MPLGVAYAMQVDDTSADLIISQLLLLDAEDHTKDIKLFINSPGGSITAGVVLNVEAAFNQYATS
jgi:ATP-dependent protease ClpP protease subunit